ncbi:hypothetical protein BSQ39_09055 [Loigolactobacillus backii]|uniref:hypothetical protein n=1 Tax=Loigolactobacillus backii TaxID=375175 RepID=UPI000C1CB4D1|nr:hypothetical protein [Loigolactobacillus backii]PIO83703.1 hypothetical protein BSQ39_09055 [Loigolactobacillus backii]
MTKLNKNWVKPGIYQIKDAAKLKVENTQEYRDVLYGLRTGVAEGCKNSDVRMNQYHANLLSLWSTQGEQRPDWINLTLSQWSSDNFKDFNTQILDWARDHSKGGMAEVRYRLRILLLRDQALAQNTALNEAKKQLNDNPNEVVGNQAGVRDLLSELPNVNEIVIDKEYQAKQGIERLKTISRSTFDHANLIVSQRINRRRLVRVDLDREALLATQPVNSKSVKKAKKTKPEQSDLEL